MRLGFVALLICVLTSGCASNAQRAAETEKKDRLIDTHIELASGYLQRGQLEIAKEHLDRALGIDSDHSGANNMMALLQWQLKEYAAAERYFQRAARTKENSEAQNNYGAFLCDRGRIEEAEERFKLALANPLYQTPAWANENAGLCFVKKQVLPKAEPYFREALRLEPERPMSLYQMARISYETNRMLAARAFIQRFFAATEDTPESLLLAVRIERALNNRNDEASYALRLRAKFPASPEAQQLQQAAPSRK